MAAETPVVYLDNNGTTLMPASVQTAMWTWTNRGNPSAAYGSGREAQQMMRNFRDVLAAESRFDPEQFELLFTSGASESNCHILTSTARAFRSRLGITPRIVTSVAEHSSVLECCRTMVRLEEAEVVFLPVRTDPGAPGYGTVDPRLLAEALAGEAGARTCLVSIMAGNNETGCISAIYSLAREAYLAKVPFHTDAVQVYGKLGLRPDAHPDAPIDAFSVSFHKMGGPPGCGLLAIRKTFLRGFGLCPLICGAQNRGLRGGTENVAAIAASFRAYKIAMDGRAAKNERLRRLRTSLRRALAAGGDVVVSDLASTRAPREGELAVAVITPPGPAALPNTLMVAVTGRGFCNIKAQAALDRRGVLVGIGSTCHTGATAPSHVVTALDLPAPLRPGVLRLSLGDDSTSADIIQFGSVWREVLASGECYIKD